jgi:hypothetical protein
MSIQRAFMIKVIINKLEFPEKDMKQQIWTSKTNGRVNLTKSNYSSGFYKENYELIYFPKSGYSPQNCLYEGIL